MFSFFNKIIYFVYLVVVIHLFSSSTIFIESNHHFHNEDITSTSSTSNRHNRRLNSNTSNTSNSFAICLTGNIRRLEIGSKIQNMIIPNLLLNYRIDIFMLLEPMESQIDALFNKYIPLYDQYSAKDLENLIRNITFKELDSMNATSQASLFNIHVKFAMPQVDYGVIGDKTPYKSSYQSRNSFEQFALTFRMFNALRHCVQWMEEFEISSRNFYDFVIRFREDTYVMDKWLFNSTNWKNSLIVSNFDSFQGICDRWFVVDRLYADKFMRGLVEHYYLEQNMVGREWFNTESLVLQCAKSVGIAIKYQNLCIMPLVTIRQLYDEQHWSLDAISVQFRLQQHITCSDVYFSYFMSLVIPISPLDVMKNISYILESKHHQVESVKESFKILKLRGNMLDTNTVEFLILPKGVNKKEKWVKWESLKSSSILKIYLKTHHHSKLLKILAE